MHSNTCELVGGRLRVVIIVVLTSNLSDKQLIPCTGSCCQSGQLLLSTQVPVSQLLLEGKKFTPVRLFQDQLFAKPPKHGKILAWCVQLFLFFPNKNC